MVHRPALPRRGRNPSLAPFWPISLPDSTLRRAQAGLLIALAAAMLTAPAAAFDAAQFASRELPSAHLSGHGSLSRFGFHLYDAELFVGPDGPPPPWEVRPLMLDLRYARPFKGRSLARRSLQEMTRLQMATDADRQRWADQLAAFLPDVSAGQHLTGIFKPGDGTHFFSDGIPIGHIAGEAFARAFFGIWLDPKTSAPELRAALTGQAR